MKRLVGQVTSPLRLVPVELGEKLAWWLFLVMIGFIAGWLFASWHWGQACFPVV